MTRHIVQRATEDRFKEPVEFRSHSAGLQRWAIVDHTTPGAVHTGFGICQLEPGGRIESHLHSFEESFYLLEGDAVLETPETTALLRPGDYGVIPLGVPHVWQNQGSTTTRWADLLTPQPRPRFSYDTYFVDFTNVAYPEPIDVRDPRCRSFGHIDPANMHAARQTQDMLAVSASMRTALLVYSGITVKMMVDSDLGAQLGTIFMVQYEPRGVAGAHDHPLEETYLILDGEVDAIFDGVNYRLSAGDVAFAGVGCVHEFSNPTSTTVRWLETQSPQPPARHSYRFVRDWRYFTDQVIKE